MSQDFNILLGVVFKAKSKAKGKGHFLLYFKNFIIIDIKNIETRLHAEFLGHRLHLSCTAHQVKLLNQFTCISA